LRKGPLIAAGVLFAIGLILIIIGGFLFHLDIFDRSMKAKVFVYI